MKKKSPALAALLNFMLPGAGYVYAGSRLRFGILLMAAMALILLGPDPQYGQDIDTQTLLADPSTIVVGVAGLMVSIGFAYDAYTDARQRNQALDKKPERKQDGGR